MSVESTRYFLKNRAWLCEHTNYDEIELMDEMVPYDLIHMLLSDIRRLMQLVMDTRNEVNALAQDEPACDILAENVFDGTYYDHPAIDRYIELFENEALKPWEA